MASFALLPSIYFSYLFTATSSEPVSLQSSIANNLDIIFLVDTSCGLSSNECTKMQYGISALISTIKSGSEPRVAYIEWSDTFHQFPYITLDDAQWNNNQIEDDSLIQQAYTNFVSNISCFNDTYPTDVSAALSFAKHHFEVHETESQKNRKKKIVLINNCVHDFADDPCDALKNGDLLVHDEEIQVIVVNINDMDKSDITEAHSYLACLTVDKSDTIFPITELTATSFEAIHDSFANAVCEIDTVLHNEGDDDVNTKYPTMSPTKSPSIDRYISNEDDLLGEDDMSSLKVEMVINISSMTLVHVLFMVLVINFVIICWCSICLKRMKHIKSKNKENQQNKV